MNDQAPARRPLRFSAGPLKVRDLPSLAAAGQEIERLGYATIAFPDHLQLPFAPLLALQAVACSTTTLRLSPAVLNQDFRHPAVLAKELATLDVLSGGRLEIGIGAGWMRREYEQAGMAFEAAPARIERLEEVITVVKGLLADAPFSFAGKHFAIAGLDGTPKPAQRPHPPVFIGGAGRRVLSVAGRHADIVQILPRAAGGGGRAAVLACTPEAFARKAGWVREAAGDRFAGIELGAQLLAATITADRPAALARFCEACRRRLGEACPPPGELDASPLVAIGTVEEVAGRLLAARDQLGISYFMLPPGAAPQQLAPVIAHLAAAGQLQHATTGATVRSLG